MLKEQVAIDFARLQLGKPYIFGTSGPDSFDCSGLTKRAAAQIGLDFYHGASTQWHRGRDENRKNAQYGYWEAWGEMASRPKDRVLFLFHASKLDDSVMEHTGLYDPLSGTVIQAGGDYQNGKSIVWEGKLNAKRWSHWATIKREEIMSEGIYIRRGMKGENVKRLQLQLMEAGYDLPKFGADADFGLETETALKKFQTDNGLPVTGIWNQACQDKIDSLLDTEGGDPDEAGDLRSRLMIASDLLDAVSESIRSVQGILQEVIDGV